MTTNAVHGVQGVQGAFLHTLHSAKPRKPWAAGGLCRVCRVNARVYVRERIFAHIKNNTALTYINTLHTLHTLHTSRMTRPVDVQGIFFSRANLTHPTHLKKIVRMMGKKIVCGPENVREFNAALRAHLPEFHELAKRLHKAGMIDGLSGATFQLLDDADDGEADNATTTHKKTCSECRQFIADSVGDGTGVGSCRVDGWKGRLKWPGRETCRKFEAVQ